VIALVLFKKVSYRQLETFSSNRVDKGLAVLENKNTRGWVGWNPGNAPGMTFSYIVLYHARSMTVSFQFFYQAKVSKQ
jgi:hypothetical protein